MNAIALYFYLKCFGIWYATGFFCCTSITVFEWLQGENITISKIFDILRYSVLGILFPLIYFAEILEKHKDNIIIYERKKK